jgi:ABC-type multidrug transport system fused ATPase/permease subunit
MTAQFENSLNAVERVRYYSAMTDLEKWDAADQKVEQSVQQGWPSEGRIEFRNMSMRYRANLDLVLRNISASIPARKRVGIVGRSGSGKSSMLLALFRMVEAAEGQILIDGVDISKISLFSLRSKLAIIPQDPVLFNGTFKYNLDPFNLHSDEEIWQALEYVQLRAVIERMADRLNTIVAEGGKNLSLGQRQLLCLARALLRNPRVICLDEATANVDIQTDEVIQRVVREKFRDSTVLVIAHRLNTVIDSDLIMVMDQGRLVEFDSPAVLKSNPNGLFYSLLQSHSTSAH